jgi:hypothetical protein
MKQYYKNIISNIVGEIVGGKTLSNMELTVDDMALKLTTHVWMTCLIRNNKCKFYFFMLYIVQLHILFALNCSCFQKLLFTI